MVSRKKKIGGGLAGIAVVGAAIALTAGTFSYFSDSHTVAGNNVQMGTLKLSVLNGSHAVAPVTLSNAEPGQTGPAKTFCFENDGTLTGLLRVGFVEDTGNGAAFNNAVQLTLAGFPAPVNGTNSLAFDAANTAGGVVLHTLTGGNGDAKCVTIALGVDPTAGNNVQGRTGGFKIVADLTQTGDGATTPPFVAPAA
ncbi:MAG: TasA family protein [Sciscionella sp.]